MPSNRASASPGSSVAEEARLFGWGARAIYVGPTLNLSAHRNAVAVIALGLDAAFGVAEPPVLAPPRYRQCRSVLIPPNTLHHFSGSMGRMAFIYIDPASRDFERLWRDTPSRFPHAAFDLPVEQDLVAILDALADGRIEWSQARPPLEELLSGCSGPAVDGRVKQALALLHDSARDRLSLTTIAEQVGLSESRFRHLFKAATGVPVRRYRIWVAMRVALNGLARGHNVTTAALDAGFASSAHFSTAFREMFGMEPSRLSRGGLAIHRGQSDRTATSQTRR